MCVYVCEAKPKSEELTDSVTITVPAAMTTATLSQRLTEYEWA